MGYIRISKENCFCLYEHEPVDDRKLKDFFRVGQVVLVKDKLERVIGIISFSDFKKAKENGKYPINRTFKKITFHTGYMEEVRKFFDETNYQSIPVLTEEGELIESFIRAGMTYNVEMDGGKWIDIANSHLAELVRKKGYRRIKICITDSQSDEIYSYFKHYESLYDTVEKILWYDIWKAKEADIIITNGKMNRDLHVRVYSFHSLRIELEYHLLLQNCIKNKINLYLISTPTADNVWNTTGEEKRRISKGKHWIEYLKNKESNSELLEQVLDRKDEIDQFIDSCMNLPPVVVKNQLCYEREHISAYVNVINGNRLTEGIPDGAEKHIYLSGNSFVFGPLVDDRHTVASILQAMAKRTSELKDYKVVNEGMRGIPFYESLKRLNHDQFFAGGGRYRCPVRKLKGVIF
ncbi:MAG: CBS domain-containing protein [Lachnospiraceae bacterium]|nr:CBS domain-containing protein [Lachnospiraceae bacterium]